MRQLVQEGFRLYLLTKKSHFVSSSTLDSGSESQIIMESSMIRITGLEKNQAPWHLRWFYSAMRRMFGKDLTPAKLQMRVPGIVWGVIAMEAGLARKRRISLRHIHWG